MDTQRPHDLLDNNQMEELKVAAISSRRSAAMLNRMTTLTELEHSQLKESSIDERAEWLESKGKNRNKLCNCGSGKKFKRCCID